MIFFYISQLLTKTFNNLYVYFLLARMSMKPEYPEKTHVSKQARRPHTLSYTAKVDQINFKNKLKTNN